MILLLSVLLGLGLEALRLSLFARFPAQPDFLLGITVVVALARRPPAGAAAGFLLGAMRDVIYGNPIGAAALPMTLVGWAVGSLGRSVYRESGVTQGLVLMVAGLGKGFLVYLFLRGGELAGVPSYLLRVTLPTAVLTAFAVPLVLLGVDRYFHKRLKFHERKVLVKRG